LTVRSKTHLLLPLLALGLTFAMVASAQAQTRDYRGSGGTSATLRINFGTTPHWTSVQGTRVEMLPQGERRDYDMFRYGGNYYAYDNNRWYRSSRDRGDFTAIDDQMVPGELSRVPRQHWRNYPSRWANANDPHDYRGSNSPAMSLQVQFGTRPHWTNVRGTRVMMVRQSERRGYDTFRYGGNYYAYSNNRWYRSPRANGGYVLIENRYVPRELNRVPRAHWQNYPQGWGARDNDPRYDGNNRRNMRGPNGQMPNGPDHNRP
jgi:hypothetical protein